MTPVVVRIKLRSGVQVITEVTDPVFGDAANIAMRLRGDGYTARKVGKEVHVLELDR